ncbi:DUF86 domain-containing protein [Patescibacteria group bacterium]|nr:DUF86 domain-containing protein [Patescibacteria group bacterium]MBU4016895.1 DUF86 domain-containing protein [Patescibacteria group bacterium]MBU4098336.1 DUF86 domain-containing protein [Patescibacteria group bacterium]
MIKDPDVFLHHIFESIGDIESYIKGLDKVTFKDHHHKDKQDAVVRRLEIIGEAVRHLPEEYLTQHKEVEWQKPLSMRNKLIHEYFGVDLDLVWYTIIEILPPFKKQIDQLLKKAYPQEQ